MSLDRRFALTPEALTMMDIIARTGSFAAAARELGKVPSALTYSVRQLEDALDVLLFDRSSRQARLTAAGTELLNEGRRLLAEMDAVANRVHRVSTGWETQLTIAADAIVSRQTLFELCEAFYALRPPELHGGAGPGTRLRLRTEVMAGTVEALMLGSADLAIGLPADTLAPAGIEIRPLGDAALVFVVAPRHPLAGVEEPLTDAVLRQHRGVAVADSAQRMSPLTINIQPGQDILTVSSMQAKLEAQMMGLGVGFLPELLVREHVAAGRLVVKEVARQRRAVTLSYGWRSAAAPQPQKAPQGLALQWWLQQLESPTTRSALLQRGGPCPPTDDDLRPRSTAATSRGGGGLAPERPSAAAAGRDDPRPRRTAATDE
jgi:DNA-binding transcriptional LysR family regulator